MLTVRQKTLVQQSFALATGIADDVGELFYDRLFELDPSTRPMFHIDMAEQRTKAMQVLTAAVKGLDRLDQLVPVLEDLGRKHAAYGLQDRHYDLGGEALLWTLRVSLGVQFTPEVEDAWAAAYGLIATTMKNGARRDVERATYAEIC